MTRSHHRGAEDDHIIAFYDRLVRRFGTHPNALDWGSRISQETRFAVLAEVGDLSERRVLDVGCGLADLYAYLAANGIAVRYTGYDTAPQMLDSAQRRFPDLTMHAVDVARHHVPAAQFDYVVASGLFNLRREGAYGYVAAMVEQMYRVCRRGVAFNSLSSRADGLEGGHFLADPSAVLDICLDIAPRCVLRHDYLPHDFTVYLYKQPVTPPQTP